MPDWHPVAVVEVTETIDPIVASITAEIQQAAAIGDLRTIISAALDDDDYTPLVLRCVAEIAAEHPIAGRWSVSNNVVSGSPLDTALRLMAAIAGKTPLRAAELICRTIEQPTAYLVETLRELMRVIEDNNNTREAG